MSKSQRSTTWSHAVLVIAGLLCVTVLAGLNKIGGDVALIAIVSILGAGGVNTALTVLSGVQPRPSAAELPIEPAKRGPGA